MARFVPALIILSMVTTACEEETFSTQGPFLPDIEVSTDHIDFGEIAWGETAWSDASITNHGELPLGIVSLALSNESSEENFLLQWSNVDLSCTGGGEGGGASTARMAEEDGEGNEEGTSQTYGQITILQPGCKLGFRIGVAPSTVGPMYGSVEIVMADDDADEPRYYADPDHKREVILLQSVGTKGAGNIVISPRNMNFGYPWKTDPLQDYIRVHNVGNGTLNIGAPVLDPDCSEAISIDLTDIEEGTSLEPYTSTLIPVVYNPTATEEVECKVTIPSDDIDMPSITVTVKANEGDDPQCTPPSVQILSPTSGWRHETTGDLELEVKISDEQQPATTLECTVRSAIIGEGDRLAFCTPTDESGYALVQIPSNELRAGRDTITVTVEDECGFEITASVSVLIWTSYSENDQDGDGFDELDAIPDCDDTNPNTYPFATEIHDNLDNDCDAQIDEGTVGSDDDGDGRTELEGDCNDSDPTTFEGAAERADWVDNDCDGEIDEDTTLVDDDGDGFAEVDNDCDDRNPDISPAAIEYCDGLDNNCNGLKDQRDGCISLDAEPTIIGGLQMDATAVKAGESILMKVTVFDPDGEHIGYAWQEDEALTAMGHDGLDTVNAQIVTWTAPTSLPDDATKETFTINVVASDESGNQDYAVGEITVYMRGVPDRLIDEAAELDEEEKKGCGGNNEDDEEASSAAVFPGVALLLLAGMRRRRD